MQTIKLLSVPALSSRVVGRTILLVKQQSVCVRRRGLVSGPAGDRRGGVAGAVGHIHNIAPAIHVANDCESTIHLILTSFR